MENLDTNILIRELAKNAQKNKVFIDLMYKLKNSTFLNDSLDSPISLDEEIIMPNSKEIAIKDNDSLEDNSQVLKVNLDKIDIIGDLEVGDLEAIKPIEIIEKVEFIKEELTVTPINSLKFSVREDVMLESVKPIESIREVEPMQEIDEEKKLVVKAIIDKKLEQKSGLHSKSGSFFDLEVSMNDEIVITKNKEANIKKIPESVKQLEVIQVEEVVVVNAPINPVAKIKADFPDLLDFEVSMDDEIIISKKNETGISEVSHPARQIETIEVEEVVAIINIKEELTEKVASEAIIEQKAFRDFLDFEISMDDKIVKLVNGTIILQSIESFEEIIEINTLVGEVGGVQDSIDAQSIEVEEMVQIINLPEVEEVIQVVDIAEVENVFQIINVEIGNLQSYKEASIIQDIGNKLENYSHRAILDIHTGYINYSNDELIIPGWLEIDESGIFQYDGNNYTIAFFNESTEIVSTDVIDSKGEYKIRIGLGNNLENIIINNSIVENLYDNYISNGDLNSSNNICGLYSMHNHNGSQGPVQIEKILSMTHCVSEGILELLT